MSIEIGDICLYDTTLFGYNHFSCKYVVVTEKVNIDHHIKVKIIGSINYGGIGQYIGEKFKAPPIDKLAQLQ